MTCINVRQKVGRLESSTEQTIVWRVPGFPSLPDGEECRCYSRSFRCLGHWWRLELRPNGRGADPSQGSLELSLVSCDPGPAKRIGIRVGVETERGVTEEWGSGRFYFNHECWTIRVTGLPRSEVLRRRDDLLPGDRLTIVVTMEEGRAPATCAPDDPYETESEVEKAAVRALPVKRAFQKMQEDMKNLLATGEDSDVIVKVRGREFPAHKSILRARVPAFKAMFGHDTVERKSGTLEIEDCDPDTFADFLTYVYTGSERHIRGENVSGLFACADKYCLVELREACVSFMKDNISVETFCDVTSLAVFHGEKDLLETLTGFFCTHSRKIVRSPKWETFQHEHTREANALLLKDRYV